MDEQAGEPQWVAHWGSRCWTCGDPIGAVDATHVCTPPPGEPVAEGTPVVTTITPAGGVL